MTQEMHSYTLRDHIVWQFGYNQDWPVSHKVIGTGKYRTRIRKHEPNV